MCSSHAHAHANAHAACWCASVLVCWGAHLRSRHQLGAAAVDVRPHVRVGAASTATASGVVAGIRGGALFLSAPQANASVFWHNGSGSASKGIRLVAAGSGSARKWQCYTVSLPRAAAPQSKASVLWQAGSRSALSLSVTDVTFPTSWTILQQGSPRITSDRDAMRINLPQSPRIVRKERQCLTCPRSGRPGRSSLKPATRVLSNLLSLPLHLVGVSIAMERGRQQNGRTLAGGWRGRKAGWRPAGARGAAQRPAF